MSAGRRNGLSAADSNAERVNVEVLEAVGGALDGLEDGRGRLGVVTGLVLRGRPPASASAVLRRAIAWRSRSAPSRCSSTWRSRSSRCARTASSSPSRASCAASQSSEGSPAVDSAAVCSASWRRSASRASALAARDSARVTSASRRDRAAGLLVALGLGRLAPAARRLGLAAEVLDAAQLALQRALAGVHVAGAALGLAQPREQRRVGHLGGGEEAVPRAEDLDDDVGMRPVLGLQPVLRARRLADEDDPAVEVREVVGLLDEERDLAQPRVGLGAARPARAAGAALAGGPGLAGVRRASPRRASVRALGLAGVRRAGRDGRGVVRRGRAAVLLALRASLALLRHGRSADLRGLGVRRRVARQAARDHLRDAIVAHRHAVEGVSRLHRALLVGHDDELRAVGVAPGAGRGSGRC